MGYFENRYLKICPDFSVDVEERKALRVNTLKISVAELTKRLELKKVKIAKVTFLQKGYYYDADFSLGATPEYLQGFYYLQGTASQLVAETLDPQKGETVLDMAAAPGSKTTHLAQLMHGTGTLVALDSNAQRLASLRNNCERLMVPNVLLFKKDARFVADLGMEFDRILLDAPCSGNFCSEEGWFDKRNIEDIKQNGRMQKALLKAAYGVLKKGGTIVYSTCSLEPEEDELVINWFLKKYDDMELQEMNLPLGDEGIIEWENKALNPELAKTRRFWPHKTQTEGFFIAKLKKK